MKKIFALILSLTLLLAAAGCASDAVSPKDPAPAPDTEITPPADTGSETQPPETGAPSEPPATPAGPYDELLSNYRLALSEQWDGDALIEKDMSLLFAGKSDKEVGYCLLDVNNDGTDELLVGACTGAAYPDRMVFDLYTLQDGAPVHVFSGEERDRYYLYQDEAAPDVYFFYNENSSSAFESGYRSLQLNGQSLTVDQAVRYDAEADSQNPWFSGADRDGAQPLEESLAKGIIESYQTAVIEPPFISFAA